MKLVLLALSVFFIAACSSMSPKTEDLRQAPTCTVWKDGPLGTKKVTQVEGELAKQLQTCWVMNMWGCTYTDYTFKTPTTGEIKSSLPPEDKTIARLEGNRMTVNMAGITVDPFEFKNNKAEYTLQGPIGPKQNMTVEYSPSCTNRQAALGLLTIIAQ